MTVLIMCCHIQPAETEQRPIASDEPAKKERRRRKGPKSQTVEHYSPDLPVEHYSPDEVSIVSAAATPVHSVELAGKHSDEICLLCCEMLRYVLLSMMLRCVSVWVLHASVFVCVCVCVCVRACVNAHMCIIDLNRLNYTNQCAPILTEIALESMQLFTLAW